MKFDGIFNCLLLGLAFSSGKNGSTRGSHGGICDKLVISSSLFFEVITAIVISFWPFRD
jgi:hypothetical protein